MRRAQHITESVTAADFGTAIVHAAKGHRNDPEATEALKRRHEMAETLYRAYRSGEYVDMLKYRELEKTNNNGKRRHIKSPSFVTRVFQHFCLDSLVPVYGAKDNLNGLNCKEGCGITARDGRRSVLHRLKHVYYDRLDLQWALVVDQRKCYDHVTVKEFRRALRMIVDDKAFVDFATDVVMVDGKLPIGTPTSPFSHHVVMLAFDIFAKGISPASVRYADDNALFFGTREEAQQAKWRVMNWWWYGLGMRAKRHTARVVPMDMPLDFCGYVLHRGGGGHSKGYVTVRKPTLERARKANDRNWGSYFGILKHADCFSEMQRIERKMKLGQLTNRIRIQRRLDAPHIDMKDVVDREVTVMDYEIRRDRDGKADWIKMLLSIPCEDGTNMAREVHGSYSYLCEFIDRAETEFGGREAIIPIEDVVIENQCGYIFRDSTNQIKHF